MNGIYRFKRLLSVLGAFLVLLVLAAPGALSRARADEWPTRNRIGIMLPLSGRFERIGKEVRRGIDLAISDLSAQGIALPRVSWIDTHSDPSRAVEGVSTLVEHDGVVGIIGPVVSAEVDGAAEAAAAHHVPMMVLSQKPDIPWLGSWVYRNFMTVDAQMKRLADYAVNERGIERIALVYPEERYAMELTAAFWDYAEEAGARIVLVESYPPGTSDFMALAREVVGISREKRRTKQEKLEPHIDFDALFNPDNYRSASLLAAALAYQEVPLGRFKPKDDSTPVILLGTNRWNNPNFPRDGGDYVEKSLFVDLFFPGSPDVQVRAFVKAFKKQYQHTPSMLAAIAYDSMSLMVRQARALKVPDRTALARRLSSLKGYHGLTGAFHFSAGGEAVHNLHVLSVKRHRLIQLAPPPRLGAGGGHGRGGAHPRRWWIPTPFRWIVP